MKVDYFSLVLGILFVVMFFFFKADIDLKLLWAFFAGIYINKFSTSIMLVEVLNDIKKELKK